jgi:membrane dipeptidase
VGLVLLMEGAECLRAAPELEEWWEAGLRLVGPAWSGTRFCGGTKEPGALTAEGRELLEIMAGLGCTLDISHMDEAAALQALDVYPGLVIASHSNALALLRGVDSNRHLSDRVLHGLLERDGRVGVVAYNAFLKPNWKKGERRDGITLQRMVAHIDYICQMAGDARHVGIGSDFDGGFGLQSVPEDLNTIADLHKLAPLLAEKGYSQEDIAAILGGNWLDQLEKSLS